MKYPTRTDPVVMDEAAYDRQCEANQVRMDRCREVAEQDYADGLLYGQVREWLIDDNGSDLADIAMAIVTGIDNDDLALEISRVSIAISSVRSTIDAIIEDHATDLYDSGENY